MQRLTIGAFSRLTHLSIKTLRYYHEVGLLEPAVVDPDSGYRYYRPGQAQSAQLRKDVGAWWLNALAGLRATAEAAGLEQNGPVGGIYDDDLFTQDAGHARVYLPVRDSPALEGTGVRWELPTARFAVALHVGPHSDVDRSYAALGTYAAANGRDGAGPVRERYLTGPFDTADEAQWRTEVCWPMAPAGAEAN
jgi:effector-binding domain-containing protein